MSEIAIQVEELSKRYIISHQRAGGDGLRHMLQERITAPLRWFSSKKTTAIGQDEAVSEEFWALKDVSFEIKQGEVVGIIGRNGAGKSTMLKILSRITEPTNGRITIEGRVASLLEVGTGFHPELTGRENIFLNGAILGMQRVEIKSKFDEIVEFAEVEKFLDTPVKRYSSGMYVRLAFSVAAHLEPEILIVDEVLAVGDAKFQKKCLGKMADVSRKEGRTILFVSHNLSAVRSLCSRAIQLDAGRSVFDGDVNDAIHSYLAGEICTAAIHEWTGADAPRDGCFAFRRVYIVNEHGEPVSSVAHNEPIVLCMEYDLSEDVNGFRVGFHIQNEEGIDICGSNDFHVTSDAARVASRYVSRCSLPGHVLNEGRYNVRFGAETANNELNLTTAFCLSFSVEDIERHGEARHRLPGVLRPRLAWSVSSEQDQSQH